MRKRLPVLGEREARRHVEPTQGEETHGVRDRGVEVVTPAQPGAVTEALPSV